MQITTKPIPTITEEIKKRFLSKISHPLIHGACMEWTAAKFSDGYGAFQIGKSTFKSHRITYFLATGEDPINLLVRHSCHNRACCNPNHLSKGTVQDNSDDMKRAGRSCKGSNNGRAKITPEQVIAIRADGRSQQSIALDYGVSQVQISLIKRRKLWSHLA